MAERREGAEVATVLAFGSDCICAFRIAYPPIFVLSEAFSVGHLQADAGVTGIWSASLLGFACTF
jgi:hypothetical protein